ncbi:3-hydroxyacyl-CoA dehydrogenase [Granulicella sp. WH15]|uniref:3-hydroxyacyl-CoA dehydrogenase NAD-binding domain-containing protein n=1 Tax=Granulicella sp. WH15 TaxID=2602070 RepID=UPI0013676EBF|nr:3-hydroxyacyl-CoA dehydrogenase NAD-binding domain-containing protein [Granulicella sp. WH15]QHN03101.1 3-hydroxyacyl-CoA dehydrogenase [Granulicella sp. WH15]
MAEPVSEPLLTVAVIGAGSAGRSFALRAAQAGFRVILEDVMPAKLRDAAAEFLQLGTAVELALTVEDAVQNADIAVDFVPDELESKLEIFSLLDRMAPPRTILLTPSEVLSVTDLASCTYRADRCVMVRGLVAASDTVRLLHPRKAAAHTVDLASELLVRIGRKVAVELDPDLPMLMKNMGYAVGDAELE